MVVTGQEKGGGGKYDGNADGRPNRLYNCILGYSVKAKCCLMSSLLRLTLAQPLTQQVEA